MSLPTLTGRRVLVASALLAAAAGGGRLAVGSDHQDTPLVELNPKRPSGSTVPLTSARPASSVIVVVPPFATAKSASFPKACCNGSAWPSRCAASRICSCSMNLSRDWIRWCAMN